MSGRAIRRGFAARPGGTECSNKADEACVGCADDATAFAARLTNDVAPMPHGRVEVAAFRYGIAVVDTQREPRGPARSPKHLESRHE